MAKKQAKKKSAPSKAAEPEKKADEVDDGLEFDRVSAPRKEVVLNVCGRRVVRYV